MFNLRIKIFIIEVDLVKRVIVAIIKFSLIWKRNKNKKIF